MAETLFDQIQEDAKALKFDLSVQEIALLSKEKNFSDASLQAIEAALGYLSKKKKEAIIETLLRMSRLPKKEPKTFENFDFSFIHGKDVELLKNLPTLSSLYAHKNLAFIGPQGVGKTHLAMAFGHECCLHGLKAYYLKASELNDRFTRARKNDKTASVVNGLVKPSCLIIDEIGRCIFDEANTRMFFDVVDRRNEKEGANCMIYTSNKQPNVWRDYFSEDDSLLCALDRIFDDATVYNIKGKSYRGRKLKTVALEAGDTEQQPRPEE